LRDDPRCIEEFAIVLVVGANMASLPTIGRVVRAAWSRKLVVVLLTNIDYGDIIIDMRISSRVALKLYPAVVWE